MAKRVPEGPPPEPVVQRLRLQYAKRGRLRFTSTRDFQRALERALRRAGVPMAFSAGFHPHPKISYANAAATGTASEAEYVEIQLSRRRDPEQLRADLDAALPPGLDVVRAVEAAPGALADRLEASRWTLEFTEVAPEALAAAVAELMQRERAEVTRMMKRGPRTFDVRAAVLGARVRPGTATLELLLQHGTPAVRPGDVLTALEEHAVLGSAGSPLTTRLAQGPLVGDTVGDPLDGDGAAGVR